MKIIRIFNIRSEMKFDVEHIDSIESLNFKLFVLERVLFGDVSNFTPITGRRTTTEFDLFQASQVQDHSKKVGTSKGSVIYLSIFDLPDDRTTHVRVRV